MGQKDSDKATAVEGKLQTRLTDLFKKKWVYYVRNPSECCEREREREREREFDDLCKKVKNTKTLYMIIVTNSDSGGRKYEL